MNKISKDKIKDFLSDRYNLILVLILVFAFIVRLYFLFQTYNQPTWWDSSEYLSFSKHWVYNIPYDLNPQRPILFPFLASFFFLIGLGEVAIRFFLVLLPSLGVVFVTYLLGKELYNKKIGLISSFIMSFFWVLLFNTARIHTDALALLFSLLALYFFWKGYVKKESKHYFWLMALFLSLGFLTRLSSALVVLIIGFYLLITERIKFLKNKKLWYFGILTLVFITPYLFWVNSNFGDPFAFSYSYVGAKDIAANIAKEPSWHIFSFFKLYNGLTLFAVFLIGLTTFFNFILGFDLVIKNKSSKLRADLFTLLIILIPLIYFVFIERSNAEPRWLLLMSAPIFFIVAKGFMFVNKLAVKYHKHLGLAFIIIFLLIGGYTQLKQSNDLIEVKKDSYLPVKLAGLWIKEHSNKDDVVFSKSVPQTSYYSERETYGVPRPENFEKQAEGKNLKYVIISVFELHPEGINEYIDQNKDIFEPVQLYFADPSQQQLVLAIYEYKKSSN